MHFLFGWELPPENVDFYGRKRYRSSIIPNTQMIVVARSGFTTVQWIVAVAVVAVLAATLIPVMNYGREAARRSKCADNLRLIGIAAQRYADLNRGRLPTMEPGAGWAWDVPVDTTSRLLETGAIRLETFYCLSGRFKERLRLWEHGVTRTGNNEDGIRVISYVLLLQGARRVLPQYTNSVLEAPAGESTGSNFAETPTSKRELAVDAVLSAGGGRDANFHSIILGNSPTPDRTNHLKGTRPAGGNVLFLDGHVEWRDFDEMEDTKADGRPVFWW